MSVPVQTSSFRKRENQSTVNIAGTKMSATNSTLIVSTGVASLDAIIGKHFLLHYGSNNFKLGVFNQIVDGGLSMGSLCLIGKILFF